MRVLAALAAVVTMASPRRVPGYNTPYITQTNVRAWPCALSLKSDDGNVYHHHWQPSVEEDVKDTVANSTCTLHVNTGVTNGHDVARAAATTATECMEACEANSLCCCHH